MSPGPEAAYHSAGQPSVEFFTLKQRPELEDQVELLHESAWDKFLEGAPWEYWDSLFDVFADFQILLCNPHNTVVAAGHSVPIVWDGSLKDLPSTLDDIIRRGLNAFHHGCQPTTLSALAAMVMPERRKQGLSSLLIQAMRSLAARHGYESLVAPVGPILKHLYPLTPMERYMRWKRADGSPFDPWIRVHWQLGARVLCVAPTTAISTGTVTQWEEWTGMRFPESGSYIVPGAQQPVEIDRERDIGRYEDPGVWMRHPIAPGENGRPR